MIPGVYYIRSYLIDKTPYYRLEYAYPRYELPERIYGDVKDNMVRVWNEYAISGKSTGVMLTGESGNSKTLSGQILSNLAIDNDIPVVMVTEINFTIELIAFITRLANCVIFLDEFRKNISYELEAKSLTMFNDLGNTKKLFILTENDKRNISSYIRNRPGRFRYHFSFDKISKSVFKDYVNSHNVRDNFKQELEERYNKSSVFSFDHLQTIISEHIHYPDDSVDEIFSVLNVETLRRIKMFKVLDIVKLSNPDEKVMFREQTYSSSEESIKGGGPIWVDILEDDKRSEEVSFVYTMFEQLDAEEEIYLCISRCGKYQAKIGLKYAETSSGNYTLIKR